MTDTPETPGRPDTPVPDAASEAEEPRTTAQPDATEAATSGASEGSAGSVPPEPPPAPPAESVEPVAAGRADLGKRAVAIIIDAVIAFVVGLVPVAGGIVATAYWLVRDGLEFEFMDHRSIGKKIMQLRPVTEDGRPVDIMTSVKRNWMFAIGGVAQFFAMTVVGLLVAVPLWLVATVIGIIEIVLVVTDAAGRRMGDKMAGTHVIESD